MPYSVVFLATEECKKDLEELGYEKQEVYMKVVSKEQKPHEENILANMKHNPYQFAITDYWGAGPG